ncbi:hypothetical protein N9022_01985 [bacterium]|nr:hypothetical protein [Akkermansiaceae bacterium]MDB4551903.1 hypothetical protein [bacterium]
MKIVMGIFLLLFLGGCGSEKSEAEAEAEAEAGVMAEGQVFVVTKSRENIKMGLVPIHVVPDEQFKIIASELAQQIMVFRVEGAQQKANENAKEEFAKELMSLEKPELSVPVLKALREEAVLPIVKATGQNRFTSSEGLGFSTELLFSKLPPAVVKTDADGRFKLLFKPKVWVIAQAARSVGDKSENYLWIVPVESPKEGLVSPLLISNDSEYKSVERVFTLLASEGGESKELPSLSSAGVDQETSQWIREAKEKANSAIKEVMIEEQARLGAAEATEQTRLDAAEAAEQARLDAAQAAEQARILELASIRDSWSLRTLLRGSRSELVAWGENEDQQCDVPAGLTNVVGISGGSDHSLALKGDGSVVAWGQNEWKQCDVPTGLKNVIGISGGIFSHSLAVRKDGTVVAWGYNKDKQCDVPAGLADVIGVSGGSGHSLALKNDGSVVAWGDNKWKQCDVPVDLTDVVEVSGGGRHSLALKKDGSVVAWGRNEQKQSDVPIGLTDVVGISGGGRHSLAVKKDGTVVAWGENDEKQCDVPIGLTDVVGISAGFFNSLAVKKDGSVVAWGRNEQKQCDVPIGLTNVVGISGGSGHTLVIKKKSNN